MGNVGNVKFYSIKNEIRILGIDDAPFDFHRDKTTFLVGTVFRGGSWLDGVLKTEIEIDGIDSTEKISEMVRKTRHRDLRVIMLDGLGFGGFNLVNIRELFEKTRLPVIVVVRQMPDFDSIKRAIKNLPNRNFYQRCIEDAGIPRGVETKPGKYIYIQYRGIKFSDASKIVKLSSTRSLIPEPIRVAHLIASGIKLGESRGNA
ncbi:MAG: hypothetical protein DRO90_01065 [Candidatus Altiarchaeales archaeon]|nr:MAG: hypothetical protein DRO95_00620 [Candidatus Altiarchaeales archaeon]RLI94567.1 MAG: hypothetical protein DRO94_02545 [Candidatus Altiarchaeales archaeon]RLI95048.1 MAG: hypothetical protein DRO90_01065 [Candidatus Altiarchaeales archaeon]HDO82137.1 DUF99 family protein [Candidatus Altiarchaeales archaeon]HEX54786.1 DUF99 family protein [Candidatus Altiarchaeales archaeon]